MKNKQIHAGNKPYDENFYRINTETSHRRASIILPIITEYIRPRSVIDIGCGVGGWLEVWQKLVGAEIYGIDGDYVERSWLSIDEKFFHPVNLEERINLNRRFDLVMSIEVAEHLTPSRADSFVEDLTRLGDVIFFSAAIPAQGGDNHVNEQWQSYWAEKFLRLGYVGIDCIRPRIWSNVNIESFSRQNSFLYAKSLELYRYPELQEFYLKHRDGIIFDVVHPETYAGKILEFKNFYRQVQEYLSNEK